jgi:hypothetical protein
MKTLIQLLLTHRTNFNIAGANIKYKYIETTMSLLGTKLLLGQLGNVDALLPREQANQIQNAGQFHSLVENCRAIPGTEAIIARIEQNQFYKGGGVTLPLNDVSRALVKEAHALRDFLKLVQVFVTSASTSEAGESDIYVRFPKADDLPALTQQLNALQKILEQTILDANVGGKMVVKSVDNGSFIILLYLGSITAVTFIGGLTWAAAVVYKKYQEALLVKMHVEALEIRNESLIEIKKAQKEMLKDVVSAGARHLEKEIYGGEESPERLERIKHSIETLQGLLEKGAEVHPALMAPEQVKNLFPNYQKLGSVESRIKQIAEQAAA